MARRRGNVKVENMLDSHILWLCESADADCAKKRKATQDKAELEALAKLVGRTSVVRRRTETRIANRLVGPKAQVNLEELL